MYIRENGFLRGEEFSLAQREAWICPWLLRGSLGMSRLEGTSLTVWGLWVTLDSLTMKFRVQVLGHMVLNPPLE